MIDNAGTYGGNGFANGIYYSASPPRSVRVANVSVTGVLNAGIYVGVSGTLVESCSVWTAGYVGVQAQYAVNTQAIDCGLQGLVVNTAENCYGYGRYNGIRAYESANNSYGVSIGSSGSGIQTSTATNCRAFAYGSDYALSADMVSNSYGSNGGTGGGIYASYSAQNCFGFGVGLAGINARNVQSCQGQSNGGDGINAVEVMNSTGICAAGFNSGIYASLASNCYGSSSGGNGLTVRISAFCVGNSSFHGIDAVTVRICFRKSQRVFHRHPPILLRFRRKSLSLTFIDVSDISSENRR